MTMVNGVYIAANPRVRNGLEDVDDRMLYISICISDVLVTLIKALCVKFQ